MQINHPENALDASPNYREAGRTYSIGRFDSKRPRFESKA
jgi:hypothetical protein